MTSLPLHPAVVHLPLGLAFVMPALAIGFAWAVWTRRIRPRAWFALVALQALLLGAGLVAMNTGEREEDRVESVVPEAAISRHEAAADQFLWATGATFVLIGLVPVLRRSTATRALTVASVAGTLVVAAMAIRVGHAGGQLVYVHNAGAAYATASAATAEAAASGSEPTKPTARPTDDDR